MLSWAPLPLCGVSEPLRIVPAVGLGLYRVPLTRFTVPLASLTLLDLHENKVRAACPLWGEVRAGPEQLESQSVSQTNTGQPRFKRKENGPSAFHERSVKEFAAILMGTLKEPHTPNGLNSGVLPCFNVQTLS